MGYDIEKEKREAIEAGQRALSSLRTAKENLNSAKNWGLVVWRWILFYDVETLQDGPGQTKYGTGEI
mgnify:CR=1 FL=1